MNFFYRLPLLGRLLLVVITMIILGFSAIIILTYQAMSLQRAEANNYTYEQVQRQANQVTEKLNAAQSTAGETPKGQVDK